MAAAERVSIGFAGGQVVEVKIAADTLKELRKELDRARGLVSTSKPRRATSRSICDRSSSSEAPPLPHGIGFGG